VVAPGRKQSLMERKCVGKKLSCQTTETDLADTSIKPINYQIESELQELIPPSKSMHRDASTSERATKRKKDRTLDIKDVLCVFQSGESPLWINRCK
jgi:hypothetical protein